MPGRLSDADDAWGLPDDLATESSALTAHPRYRYSSAAVFGHPADWASLSCLDA